MKLTGISGTGTGRVGAYVFAVRKGVQIVRQHQPVVLNPKTQAQVEQRAKMKLASQVSAALANQIKPWKQVAPVNVSARNMFTKALFDDNALTFSNLKAYCDLEKIRLTGSSVDGVIILTSSVQVSGIVLSFDAYSLPEFIDDTMVHAVVIRNSVNGPEVLGYADAEVNAGGTTTMSVSCKSAPVANDLLFVYAAKVNTTLLPTIYKNIYASGGVQAILDVIQRERTSALRFSRTVHLKLTV